MTAVNPDPALMPTYARAEIEIVEGKGAYLFDAQGRDYLDFASGIAVNALGHGDPRLLAALTEQAGRLWHSSNLYRIPQQEHLAEALCAASFAERVFFGNSGAEAMEAAIKTVKRYHFVGDAPERHRFITFTNAFHGRTLATVSATDQKKIRDGFEPLLDWFDHVPFNDLDAVQAAIGPHTAGIIVEPIQGEGGLEIATPQFLRGLRALCDQHGILLIFDEVQTGMGRTGTLFAYQQTGTTPDIMALAKGLGGGFPIGACLATANAARGMTAGVHGSTFGGNPLGCAVGLAVIQAIATPQFLQTVTERGKILRETLERLVARHSMLFAEVRGVGLMLGMRCTVPSRDFVNHARNFGIMTAAAGGDVVRVYAPLNVAVEDIKIGENRLSAAAQGWQESTSFLEKRSKKL